MGLSFHPGKNTNGKLFLHSLGKKNRLAMNFGLGIGIEFKFNNYISLKFDQVAFADCAEKFAGLSMLNLRYTQNLGVLGNGSVGLGPFFYYRKNWNSIPDYVDEGFFKISKNNKWQRKFVWYGGELEHNYPLKNGLDISSNILPGIPIVYAFCTGVRFSNPKL